MAVETIAAVNMTRISYRKLRDKIWWIFSAIALVFIIIPLISILWGILKNALLHFSFSVLFETTKGNAGGLSNAIVGTLFIMLLVAIVAGTVGIGTGIYLSEFRKNKIGEVLRTAGEVLAGIPSIVLGYVGYVLFVVGLNWGFSLGAALIVLSVMVVPYITKATEVSLSRVPTAYREAAAALGLTKSRTVFRVILRPAIPGIATGVILAMAIAVGETAPLLYTAGWFAGYPHLAFTHSPIGYLTYVIWTDWNQPYAASKYLSYDASLVLILMIFGLIGLARLMSKTARKYQPEEGFLGSRGMLKRSTRVPRGPS
jgi:phosphate transport system permease protein